MHGPSRLQYLLKRQIVIAPVVTTYLHLCPAVCQELQQVFILQPEHFIFLTKSVTVLHSSTTLKRSLSCSDFLLYHPVLLEFQCKILPFFLG